MVKILLILGLVVGSSLAQDCWWTGCQPNDWAVVGCNQYGREERGREGCTDGRGVAGFKYHCCEGGDGGGGGPGDGDEGGALNINYDQFSRAVTSNGYPAPSQEQYQNFVNSAKTTGRINTMREGAMALAQLLHESDGLRAKREYACEVSQCPDSYRTPGCDAPGQYYYGRGYIQLSWCYNYRDASAALYNDARLINDPDQVAREDSIAWATAFWYWGSRVHDYPGVAGGQFGASTKAINGGLECGGTGHPGPASRFRLYGNVRAAFGLAGPGDPSGC